MLSTDVMFWSGLIGAVIFRRNLIVMLLATEIVMLACNLNFLFAAAYLNDMTVGAYVQGLLCALKPIADLAHEAVVQIC
jgi:NADH:ubiquinone oxidoreductase subunit K